MRIKNWNNKISWSNAIIELVLITVGLFMAIQIENWRENIKEKQIERKLLSEIKVSLEKDLAFLSEIIIPRAIEVIDTTHELLRFIDEGFDHYDMYKKDFIQLTYGLEFEPRTSAFENLKSTNINLISNDDLRLHLVDLYDFRFQRTFRIINDVINIPRKNRILPYMEENVEFYTLENEDNDFWPSLFIPEEILITKEFYNILININYGFSNSLLRLNRIEEMIRELMEEIDIELSS